MIAEVEPKPGSNPNADERETNRSAAKPDRFRSPSQSSRESAKRSSEKADHSRSSSQSSCRSVKPKESYPLADALFSAIGQHLDADETERQFFGELAEQLWRGNFVRDTAAGPVSQAYASKARLERVLHTVHTIREKYHQRLFDAKVFQDRDLRRSLSMDETKALHNEWMNDVASWMNPDCLQQYNDLIDEADELDKNKGKGKRQGKKSKAKGKEKGSVGKPAGSSPGPRQRAQQLKKQRFNKVLSDLACKKAFFMSFVRHPSYDSVDSIKELLTDLTEVMKSRDYKDMVRDSAKKTEEESKQKRQCHQW